jgi:hypothetical protein
VTFWSWDNEESPHDRAVRTAKSYLKKKHRVQFAENQSVGAGRRPDLSAQDETKKTWYLCEIKDSRTDLQRALDQFDHNRSFLQRKYRGWKVVCYVVVTKDLYDAMSTSQVGFLKEWQSRMRKNSIKVLVASKSTVKPA